MKKILGCVFAVLLLGSTLGQAQESVKDGEAGQLSLSELTKRLEVLETMVANKTALAQQRSLKIVYRGVISFNSWDQDVLYWYHGLYPSTSEIIKHLRNGRKEYGNDSTAKRMRGTKEAGDGSFAVTRLALPRGSNNDNTFCYIVGVFGAFDGWGEQAHIIRYHDGIYLSALHAGSGAGMVSVECVTIK